MGDFIKNQKHFINYLNKVIKDNNIDKNQLYNSQFYIEQIYNRKLADEFTWELRTDPLIITKNRVKSWLRQENKHKLPTRTFNHIMTNRFKELIEDLKQVSGIYSFWTYDGTPLYVGRSKNLGSRIPSSYERLRTMEESIYLKYIRTKSVSDTVILEAYYITKLNPCLNQESEFSDKISADIKLNNPPSFGKSILCNKIEIPNDQKKLQLGDINGE